MGDEAPADHGEARQAHRPAIYFVSDYGLDDEFVGVVHSVLDTATGGARVVDVAHGIRSFDVRAGALLLTRVVSSLGPGVILAVVDPGVGTARRGVAIEVADGRPASGSRGKGPRWLVGPDNGLFGWTIDALGGAVSACVLEPARHVGAPRTFDGRDVFAPAAARLWAGEPLATLGPFISVGELVRLAPLRIEIMSDARESGVTWVDRFGNVQLAAGERDATAAGVGAGSALDARVLAPSGRHRHRVRWVAAFGELDAHELGVLIDANGRLAIVERGGSAATTLGVAAGDMVHVGVPEQGDVERRR